MRIHGWEDAEVRETHISAVLIGRERVLKIKKPVALGFLDFSTLEKQKAACDAEMALNERTAPGITIGVRSLTLRDDGDGVDVDGPGEVLQWAVEMQRLPDDARMRSWLDAGILGPTEIDRVASWLAEFHGEAPVRSDHGSAEWVHALVEENFEDLPEANELLGPERAERARAWQRDALPHALLEERRESGWVRDGHGDLRLDHVYLLSLPWAPRIIAIDGVEFDPRYRCLDVAADVGFLMMELALHGRWDLAERLVAQWALHIGDWQVYSVLDGYVAYRAWVRAKVRIMQGNRDAARERLDLAWALIERRERARPVLIAVGGPIAAGKSTVAQQLASALSAPVIDADRTRKQLAGVEVFERLGDEPFGGAYSEQATEQVYQTVAERAAAVLQSRRTVIVDASFRAPALRSFVKRVGQRLGVPVRFIACTAPRSELRARLEARDAAPGVSDARAPLLDKFLARYSAPTGPEVLTVDTSRPVDLDSVLAFLDAATR